MLDRRLNSQGHYPPINVLDSFEPVDEFQCAARSNWKKQGGCGSY